MSHYILKDRKIVRVGLLQWARWFGIRENRVVAKSDVCGLRVSTIFMGMDRGEMWETMVFKGPLIEPEDARDLDMDRCEGGFEQAEEMHARMCDKIRRAMGVTTENPNDEAEDSSGDSSAATPPDSRTEDDGRGHPEEAAPPED